MQQRPNYYLLLIITLMQIPNPHLLPIDKYPAMGGGSLSLGRELALLALRPLGVKVGRLASTTNVPGNSDANTKP